MSNSRNLWTAAALAAILSLGLAVRVVFWYGLVNVDPYAYADAAESVARQQPVFDPDIIGALYYTQYLRLSLVVPAAIGYAGWGPGEVQSIAFPIACSLATGLVAFWLVLYISRDRVAGLIACLLTVFFPENVINSTQFLPDTVMTFFSALTILLFWRGIGAGERSWRERAMLFAATGAAWALAFYGKQTAVGLAIPLAGLALYYRRFDWTMVGGVAGAALVGLGMSILLLSLGGEPFEDIKTVVSEGRGSQSGALGYTDLDFTYIKTFTTNVKFLPLTAMALFGTVLIAISWRDYTPVTRRRLTGLFIVVAGLFVYFEFLMRLPSLYSWWKEPRYALTVVVPLAALSGIGLTRWIRMVSERYRLATYGYIGVLMAFVLAFNFSSVRADHEYWEHNRIDLVAGNLARAIDSRPEETVFLWNDDLSRYLSFHVGLERTTFFERSQGRGYLQNRFDAEGRSRVTPGSLVVTSPGQDQWPKATTHAVHWGLVWTDGKGTAVWAVPATADAVPMEAVDASLSTSVTINRFGLSESAVLPQQHVVMSLEIENRGIEATAIIGAECGESVSILGRVEALPGKRIFSSDVAVNLPASNRSRQCRLLAAVDSEHWLPVGTVEVGGVTYLEPERPFSHDADAERANKSGWYRNDQPFYSEGGSVVAITPYQPLKLNFPDIEGDVWVDFGVYNYGGGANTVSVSLNGAIGQVTWGSEGGNGVIHRVLPLSAAPLGGELTVTIDIAGQSAVTIDSIAITTIAPPKPSQP